MIGSLGNNSENMVFSNREIDGAALVSSSYEITIKLLDDDTLCARIRARIATEVAPPPRPHRSAGTAVSDIMHQNLLGTVSLIAA
jgi:hypothetical protein